MSYPPYGGGGYPPQQPGGYPPQQPGAYPPAQPGGYPPQPGGYPTGQQPYPSGGGYPPQPGMPQAYPSGGAPYPGQQAGGYPPAPGFSGMPTPESATQAAGAPGHSTYPGAQPGYPAQGGYPPGPYPSQGGAPPPAQYQAPPGGQTLPPPQAAPRSHSPSGHYPGAVPGVTAQMGHMSLKQQKGEGSIKPKAGFNGQNEAEVLRNAMKGLGTDEKAIIHVVTSCSNEQRQQILKDYKTMFGRDLVKDFKSELSGKLEKIVLALMLSAPQFDAAELRRAMKGVGTDEAALIEIMCTRTNAEIQAMKLAYKKDHGKDLEDALRSETSGHFRKLMVSMSVGGRDEKVGVDVAKAQADAKALYDAGEKQWGTDESRFNAILASRSFEQLRATFDEYAKISKRDIEKSIKSEFSGDIEKGLLTIVRCVRNKAAYFAEQLYKSMKGLGTDDDTLIRVVVSRCEKDMVQIKHEFQRMYSQPLSQFIADDTSGDYKKILLAIVGN
ncbi:annexin-B12-like isoform X3 [Ptychodera flava]|uniref:annexin-B12-like isoform X3 n=1 Tax=Ptychodera flava TaxID=63121 RepID=UPI00396A7A64